MEKEKLEIIVRKLAELLAWKDEVQQMAFPKKSLEYEKELMEALTK